MRFILITAISLCVVFSSCKKKDDSNSGTTVAKPMLIFKFKFDSTQQRLNNIGMPATVPSGHGAQSPRFNFISQHYVELAGDFDALGAGLDLAMHALDHRMYGLQVRPEQPRRHCRDVLTDAACFLRLTAPQDAVAAHLALIANFTTSRHSSLLHFS